MFRNIFIATDGSAAANRAVRYAAGLASIYHATLTVVHVVDPSIGLDEIERMPQARRFSESVKADIRDTRASVELLALGVRSPYARAPLTATMALAEEILNEAEDIAHESRANDIRRVILDGHPAQRIAEQVNSMGADLVVLGARGLGDVTSLLLGSVTRKVLHMVGCPCLVVK